MVESGGLENRCPQSGTVGSNPTFSARLDIAGSERAGFTPGSEEGVWGMRRSIPRNKYGEMRERLNRRDWKSRERVTLFGGFGSPLRHIVSFRAFGRPGVPLAGMTHRVGRKGQVVIPKACRKAARIESGDEVTSSQEATRSGSNGPSHLTTSWDGWPDTDW